MAGLVAQEETSLRGGQALPAMAVSRMHPRPSAAVISEAGDDRGEGEGDAARTVILLRCWAAVWQSSAVPRNSCRGFGPRLERRRTKDGDGGD